MSEFWFQFFYTIARVIFAIVHPRKVIGRENIPQGSCLVCGNHTRYSDPIFIVLSMGRRDHPYIMGKAELLKVPVLGWIVKKVGLIPVERGKADVKAIKECMRVLKEGKKLLIFPEGTRVKEGEDSDAKTGAAMLALRTGVPMVPVYVPNKLGWFRRTPVVFGQAYTPEVPEGQKPTAEDYRRVADDLMARIKALAERTLSERT